MPNDKSLLAARSLCLCATGDISRAESDVERIKVLSQRNSSMIDMPGIAEQAK